MLSGLQWLVRRGQSLVVWAFNEGRDAARRSRNQRSADFSPLQLATRLAGGKDMDAAKPPDGEAELIPRSKILAERKDSDG